MRAAAEYLGCSVLELAAADPSWRQAALQVLHARADAKTHRKGSE